MTFGVVPGVIIGDDEGFSIEASFERNHGSSLMKAPLKPRIAEELTKKPTKRDRARQAKDAESRAEKALAKIPELPASIFEVEIDPQTVDTPRIPDDIARLLVDRYVDDLHSMALSETDRPTLL